MVVTMYRTKVQAGVEPAAKVIMARQLFPETVEMV
jgi:hypothetical protein